MRIAGLPNDYAQTTRKAPDPRRTKVVSQAEIQPLHREQADSDSLQIDDHTLKDLEVFSAQGSGRSLFELCDYTRTKGGAEILRQRMHKPWSDPTRILSTQHSIRFIMNQRATFQTLPSYITRGMEKYLRDILLMVTQVHPFEFMIGVLSLRINQERHYHNVVRGVQIACTVIREVRLFLNQPILDSAEGELADLLGELRELMRRPLIFEIPNEDLDSPWPWRALRIDQIFRLHESATSLRILRLIYEIDALVSMADATQRHGFLLPTIDVGPAHTIGEEVVHPLLESAVANPVRLDQNQRILFLTGPNMAGKTTYLRAFAVAVYFAHLGMGVPASSFHFVPSQCLFSSISINDDLHSGISYFRAEALRIKTIAEAIAAGHRVVAVMDEPFKGTNVKDAFDVSLEVLKRLSARKDCLFMFSSHLIELDECFESTDSIGRQHFEAKEDEGRLVFDFLIRPGISSQRLGIRVLEEEGVFGILDG